MEARQAGDYDIAPGFGLYTDMNAIRADEELDNLHSLYVDQWDWEKTITDTQRTLDYLQATVRSIYGVIKETEMMIYKMFPHITPRLPEEITFCPYRRATQGVSRPHPI